MILKICLAFSLLISIVYAQSVVDFCVADLNLRIGPAGYPCKTVSQVVVGDFTSSDLGVKGNNFSINYIKTNNFKDYVHVYSLTISNRNLIKLDPLS